MRKRAPILLLALAVLLALLLWWLWPGTSTQHAADESHDSPEVAAAVDEASTTSSTRRPRRPRRPAKAPAEDDSVEEPVEQAPPDDSGLPLWEVIVLGPGGVPAIGVPFNSIDLLDSDGNAVPFETSGKRYAYRFTDENGRASLGRGVGALLKVQSPALPAGIIELTESATVLRIPELISLELLVVNGQTGTPVHGAKIWITGSGGDRVRAPVHPSKAGALLSVSPAHGGVKLDMNVHVDPPPGFSTLSGGRFQLAGTVSRYARSARAVLVLRPETTVRVRALEEDGSPAAGAVLGWVTVAGKPFKPGEQAALDERGEIEFGVPYVRGERVRMFVHKDRRAIAATPIVLSDPERIETVEVTLPAVAAVANSTIGIGGGAGGAFGGRRGGRRNLRAPGGKYGSIEALVLRRDGTPAANTLVLGPGGGSRTDGNGRVTFENVSRGKRNLRVEEPGFLASSVVAEVVEGETVQVTLREAAGRSGTVRVVDAEGVPVPFAALSVGPTGLLPHIEMDGDVQLLQLHTDANGVCELHGLPPNAVNVTVNFGSRSAEGKLGTEAALTLALAPAE